MKIVTKIPKNPLRRSKLCVDRRGHTEWGGRYIVGHPTGDTQVKDVPYHTRSCHTDCLVIILQCQQYPEIDCLWKLELHADVCSASWLSARDFQLTTGPVKAWVTGVLPESVISGTSDVYLPVSGSLVAYRLQGITG